MRHYGNLEDYRTCKNLIENLVNKKKEVENKLSTHNEYEMQIILSGINLAIVQIEEYWHGNPNNPWINKAEELSQ